MSEHDTDRLSAYLDDELSATEREAVEGHLRGCAACAATLEELRQVVRNAAGAAARDRTPANARELWNGIHARLSDARTRRVARFPDAAAAQQASRRVSLSIGQLAAAAVLLMTVSAATAWYVRGGLTPGVRQAGSMIEAEVEATPEPGVARLANFADAAYDAAVADLERALAERRNDLNPRTVEILERNLKLIDAAIAQARQALEGDPANSYLNRHLVDSRRRKLDLLRRATAINDAD